MDCIQYMQYCYLNIQDLPSRANSYTHIIWSYGGRKAILGDRYVEPVSGIVTSYSSVAHFRYLFCLYFSSDAITALQASDKCWRNDVITEYSVIKSHVGLELGPLEAMQPTVCYEIVWDDFFYYFFGHSEYKCCGHCCVAFTTPRSCMDLYSFTLI